MKKIGLLLMVAVLLAGCGPANPNVLQASGLVEATEIDVAPEMSGRVAEVFVSEGDAVAAGDPLLQVEDELLQAQQRVAVAAVASARAASQVAEAAYASAETQYQLALQSARAQDSGNRIQEWIGRRPAYFDQPRWYFTRTEQIHAAQAVVEQAEFELADAQARLEEAVQETENVGFLEAEDRLADARIRYLVTKQVYERAKLSGRDINPDDLGYPDIPLNFQGTYSDRIAIAQRLSDDPNLVEAAQRLHDAAKVELRAAQNAYNALLTSAQAVRVTDARAQVEVALEQVQGARDYLDSLRIGEYSLSVVAAQDAVEGARAGKEQAQAAVQVAEAQLDLLDLQIEKLIVKAPQAGVVLTRSVQPGEIVQAGMPVLTIARLETLTVTVYISEDRYGEVSLGDGASLQVDSFPDDTFVATVTRIADQAEYTPRNVQTREERQTTVYAVELEVSNLDGKLKPGMPADVTFAAPGR